LSRERLGHAKVSLPP